MTVTGKPAIAPEKSKTVKKKRSSAPRASNKASESGPRKTSKPSVPAKRKRTTRRKADPAVATAPSQPTGTPAIREAAAAPARLTSAGRVSVGLSVSPLTRQRMIAEAAYFKSQSRGIAGANPERDWFEAEAEVDAQLKR